MKSSGLIFSLLVALTLFCSCSVKEDRFQCPLFMFFSEDVNGVGARGEALVHVYENGSQVPTKEVPVTVNMLSAEDYGIMIRKGETVAAVLVERSASEVSGARVVYPEGKAVDELYALCEAFVTGPQDEEYQVKAVLGRQVTPVDLTLSHSGTGEYPFVMVIRSGWNGFDERTLEPLRGTYHSVLATDAVAGHYAFCVPRQGMPLDLHLEFWEGNPDSDRTARMVYSYDLGAFMVQGGYDWTEAHLKEFRMSLDYANGRFTIAVNDWRDQFVIENYVI